MKQSDIVVLSLVGLVIGLALLQDPRCLGACRTVARRLVKHSARGLLGGLRV